MIPDRWRMDGWPLCPVCGEDELADLYSNPEHVPTPDAELFCYRCARVTVKAGEGALNPRTKPGGAK